MGESSVRVEGLFLQAETSRAYGVSFGIEDNNVECWIPKSEIEDRFLSRGEEGWVVIPRWLADKMELSYEED